MIHQSSFLSWKSLSLHRSVRLLLWWPAEAQSRAERWKTCLSDLSSHHLTAGFYLNVPDGGNDNLWSVIIPDKEKIIILVTGKECLELNSFLFAIEHIAVKFLMYLFWYSMYTNIIACYLHILRMDNHILFLWFAQTFQRHLQ